VTLIGRVARSRVTKAIAIAFICLWMANFFWFIGESVGQFGSGNALSNCTVDGAHYYIYEKAHGSLVEVSKADWDWSRLHALTTEATFPVMMLAMWWLGRGERRQSASRDIRER